MGLLIIDNNFLAVAKSLLEQAKSTIEISSFKIEESGTPKGRNMQTFWDLLKRKAKEGIRIKLLLNWNDKRHSVAKTNLFTGRDLQKNNVKVRHLRNNRCCHAKIIMIDRKQAILGSHNLSIKSCESNFELSYLIPDPEAVKQLGEVFDRTWYDADKF